MQRARFIALILANFLVILGPVVSAQPAASVDSFDLVIVGDSLEGADARVSLKTNPAEGHQWTALATEKCTGEDHLRVYPTLSVRQYVGQDIRENYLAMKVVVDGPGGRLRAAYAVPSVDSLTAAACQQLRSLAENAPMVVRRHSLAVYERPRPAPLRPDTPFIDHVEVPVRHRKPGVMEVEWLNILFRPTN